MLRRVFQNVKPIFQRQHDRHGDEVKRVVHRRRREGTAKFCLSRDVPERHDLGRDGGAHVGAHHHENRAAHIHRPRRHEAHDEAGGGGRALHNGGGEDANEQTHDGRLSGFEQFGRRVFEFPFERRAHPADADQEKIQAHSHSEDFQEGQ